ncbi:MAG TPA: ribbon-helix-helix protein, CopG family [Chthoniobacterales bacterium]|jgi:predicted Zn-dependent protease with MMP-like domain|nr:ribbon-helix-helix protein, CopG family [Chthoniobacterales bacterium]
MPSATKATFSLDAASIARLQALAQKWQVPKTEVLRRALQQAAENEETLSPQEKIALLHRLQTHFAESGVDFERWKRDTKKGRR